MDHYGRSMRWQQALGVVLGFFNVGPSAAILLLQGGTGSLEILLAAAVGAIVGYFSAGSIAAKAGRRRVS